MDETSGIVDYERVIGSDILPSVTKYNYLVDAVETSDNGFVFCGYIEVLCQGSDSCHQWGWVVKLDSLGCVIPGCHTTSIEDAQLPPLAVQVFPNPAQDKITFQWQSHLRFEALSIYDMWGKEIWQRAIEPGETVYELPLQSFTDGVYIYRLQSPRGEWASGKFVKE